MQGWLFANDASFWQPAQAEALLTSIPLVRLFTVSFTLWAVPNLE